MAKAFSIDAATVLKRPLWVIGASDYNLGMTVLERADEFWDYAYITTTDEQICDVTEQLSIERVLGQFRNWGCGRQGIGLDIVYSAGINLLNPIPYVDEIDIWQTFNVNVLGFIRLMKGVVKVFPEGNVNVVAVASDAARVAMRNSINYCASKAALVQAVRVAARELAPTIRVNAVSPAIIEGTPMTTQIDAEVRLQRGWSEEEALAYERTMIPMQRRATKEEVADVILSTLNGPAFMTGSNIEITGGK